VGSRFVQCGIHVSDLIDQTFTLWRAEECSVYFNKLNDEAISIWTTIIDKGIVEFFFTKLMLGGPITMDIVISHSSSPEQRCSVRITREETPTGLTQNAAISCISR